jgi:hypothetical protein
MDLQDDFIVGAAGDFSSSTRQSCERQPSRSDRLHANDSTLYVT